MKYLFWTLTLIITVVCLYFVFSNLSAVTGITLLDNGPAEALGTFSRRMPVNTGLLLLGFFVLGSCSAVLFVKPFLIKYREKEGAFERKLEKTSVSSDENSAKVKILEAKIQTLEKALEDATKKKL